VNGSSGSRESAGRAAGSKRATAFILVFQRVMPNAASEEIAAEANVR